MGVDALYSAPILSWDGSGPTVTSHRVLHPSVVGLPSLPVPLLVSYSIFFNYTISTCHLFLPGTLTDKIIMCWISVHLYILTSITYSTTLTALLCCPVLMNSIANPSQYLHVRFIH